ncbi:MAG: serine/threonine-protein kinase [Frankiaceae bacterium]
MTTAHDQQVTGRLIASRYRLRDVIGKGGMGSVWLADDMLLHRQVAVKELRFPSSVTDEERATLRERSLREARSAARLDTPHVVRIYDVVDEGGNPCIVMELLRGRTLAQFVRSEGPLPPAVVARIGQALVDALRVAHGAGVVHRDVKPGNVFLTDSGRVVLTDFGIATSAGDPSITDTGLLVGSPAYMSPERARGGEPTSASDLWSLGATLYTAVEGHPPFDAGDPVGTLTSVVSDEPQPMRRSGELATVLGRLLTKDPTARPPVEEVATELAGIADRAGRADRAGGSGSAAAWTTAAATPAAEGDDPYPEEPSYGSDVDRTTVLRLASSDLAEDAPAAPAAPAAAAEPARVEPGRVAPAVQDRAAAPLAATAVIGNGGEVAESAVSEPTGSRLPVVGATPARAALPPTVPPTVARDETVHSGDEPDRRRTMVALVAVAVVVVAAIAVALTQLSGGSGSPTAGSPTAGSTHRAGASPAPSGGHISAAPVPSVSASGGTSGSGNGSSGSGSSGSGSSGSGSSGSASSGSGTSGGTSSGGSVGTGAAVPAGWQAYRSPDGWQVAHPAGWSVNRHVVRGETVTDLQSGGGELIRIEITPTPYQQPIDDWRNYEPQFAQRVSGYQRIAMRALTVGGHPAADWEFLYTDGIQLHALDREIRVGDTTYAILFQTHAGGWDAAASDRSAALGSFRAG